MGLIKFFKEARVAVATVFLAITLLSILLGGITFACFLSLLIYFGTVELISFMKNKGFNPSLPLVLTVDAVLIIFATFGLTEYLGMVLTIGSIAAFLVILFRGEKATIADAATTLMSIIYGGWLPVHLLLLRTLNKGGLHLFNLHFRDGVGYIFLIFMIVTISDIAGYYIGSKFGKKPLWTAISPKKTIEGSIASTVGGILTAVIIGYFIHLEFYHSLIAGILLVVIAQFGDLTESMFKRDAGVKDSSSLLPGHGGILDRADSYVFTGAVAYYYFKIFVIQGITILSFLS